jgi:hypothetical protein
MEHMDAKRRRTIRWTLTWACAWTAAVPCPGWAAPTPEVAGGSLSDPRQDPTPSAPDEAKIAFTYSDDHWYGLDAPTSTDYELDEIYAPHTAMFRIPLLDDGVDALLDAQRRLYDNTGLRIGFAYTQAYQQASGGSGDRWGTSGDVDLMFDWTLLGRGTEDTGRLFFSVEHRFRFGSEATPGELSGAIGSGIGTGAFFTDRGPVVRDVFWDQRLLGARLRVLAGRAAPDDYVGSHRLGSANFAFFNGAVGGNPTMAFVGHGPLVLVSAHPKRHLLRHRRRRQRLQRHDPD